MKPVILILLLAIQLFTNGGAAQAESLQEDPSDQEESLQEKPYFQKNSVAPDCSEIRFNHALAAAQQALTLYKYRGPQAEYNKLIDYLQYYRSWYQAVTPAPRSLVEQLSSDALLYVKNLQSAVNEFALVSPAIAGSRGQIGASTLSPEGERFYQKVIAMTREQLIDKK